MRVSVCVCGGGGEMLDDQTLPDVWFNIGHVDLVSSSSSPLYKPLEEEMTHEGIEWRVHVCVPPWLTERKKARSCLVHSTSFFVQSSIV